MFKILGVDPGSQCTGYGVVIGEGERLDYVASGTIALKKTESRYARLGSIFRQVDKIIKSHRPTHFAIENVFYSKNARSSLVLGEARGAAILAASLLEVPIFEYSPREVKQSLTGHGASDKGQVSYMMAQILSLETPIASADESDALAIAICHAFKTHDWSVL